MKNIFLKTSTVLMLAGTILASCNSNNQTSTDSDSLNAVNSGTGTVGDMARDSTDMNNQTDSLGTDTMSNNMDNSQQ